LEKLYYKFKEITTTDSLALLNAESNWAESY